MCSSYSHPTEKKAVSMNNRELKFNLFSAARMQVFWFLFDELKHESTVDTKCRSHRLNTKLLVVLTAFLFGLHFFFFLWVSQI